MDESEPCPKCQRMFKPSKKNRFTCPRCGYQRPEYRLLEVIFGDKR